jgi:hypothetical protein
MTRSWTRCPYTLKLLSALPKVNDEHIFPHSIGGSKEYKVRVDEATNSALGSKVDAAFVDSPLLGMLRSQHGIKSRSGVHEWALEGIDTGDGREVKVTFPNDGPVEVRHKRPVEIDPATGTGKIVVAPHERDKLIADLTEKYRKKGKTLQVTSEAQQPVQQIRARTTIHLDALIGGLAKIAYLAAFEFLGDEFRDDPLNGEWQKAIRAATSEEFRDAKIHGRPFGESGIHKALLPVLKAHQHAVSICAMRSVGLVVAVQLFGSEMFSLVCRVSDTSTFNLGELDGRVAVCDALARKVTVEPFESFFSRRADELLAPAAADRLRCAGMPVSFSAVRSSTSCS